MALHVRTGSGAEHRNHIRAPVSSKGDPDQIRRDLDEQARRDASPHISPPELTAQQVHEHGAEVELTWQDIATNDRLTFKSVEEMASFFDWRSGRLQEQLETAEDHIAGLCDNLLRYGRHTNSCDFRIGGCNCGWETMREALKTPNPAESHD